MAATQRSEPASEPPLASRRHALSRLVASLLIAAALGWMLARGGLPIVPGHDAFAHLEPWTVPAYLGTLVAVHTLRAIRWRHLLRPLGNVPLRSVVSIAWIGFAAILFLPLRMGEFVRPYLMGKRSTVRGWSAAGTVAGERVLDGLILSLVLFGALNATETLDPLPERVGDLAVPVAIVPRAAYAALVLFASALLVLLLFRRHRSASIRLVSATVGKLSRPWARGIEGIFERLARGLDFLPSPQRTVPFVGESLLYWASNAVGLWLLAQGTGLEAIGLPEACVIMGVLGVGILIPSGPGYFGTFQLSIYMALAMFVPPEQVAREGSAFVFIAYCCQLGQHALGGAIGAAFTWPAKLRPRNKVAS